MTLAFAASPLSGDCFMRSGSALTLGPRLEARAWSTESPIKCSVRTSRGNSSRRYRLRATKREALAVAVVHGGELELRQCGQWIVLVNWTARIEAAALVGRGIRLGPEHAATAETTHLREGKKMVCRQAGPPSSVMIGAIALTSWARQAALTRSA